MWRVHVCGCVLPLGGVRDEKCNGGLECDFFPHNIDVYINQKLSFE